MACHAKKSLQKWYINHGTYFYSFLVIVPLEHDITQFYFENIIYCNVHLRGKSRHVITCILSESTTGIIVQ